MMVLKYPLYRLGIKLVMLVSVRKKENLIRRAAVSFAGDLVPLADGLESEMAIVATA